MVARSGQGRGNQVWPLAVRRMDLHLGPGKAPRTEYTLPPRRYRSLEFLYSAGFFVISVAVPLIANPIDMGIIELIWNALDEGQVGSLLDAGMRLALMNTVQDLPIYLGALSLAEVLARRYKDKPQVLYYAVPIATVPLVYWIVYRVHGVAYDFTMPAILGIAGVVYVLRLGSASPIKQKWKSLWIVTLLLSGFQWLSISPALTALGFGHGDVSLDLKVAASVLDAEPLLNTLSFMGASMMVISGLITSKFMIDYQAHIRLVQEEKRRSLQLERMRSEAMQARTYRELQVLVHDLRTPLTTIQGLASAMSGFSVSSVDARVHAQAISEAADRMDDMIGELLSGSARRPMSSAQFARRLAAHLPSEKTNRAVDMHIGSNLPQIEVNETRLVRAVANLVDNALDAGSSNVDIRFERKGEFLALSVVDDGPGLSEEELDQCWEEGFSTKSSSGLGLSFVNQVVKEHGGTVYIENRSAPENVDSSASGSCGPAGVRCVILIPEYDEGGV